MTSKSTILKRELQNQRVLAYYLAENRYLKDRVKKFREVIKIAKKKREPVPVQPLTICGGCGMSYKVAYSVKFENEEEEGEYCTECLFELKQAYDSTVESYRLIED